MKNSLKLSAAVLSALFLVSCIQMTDTLVFPSKDPIDHFSPDGTGLASLSADEWTYIQLPSSAKGIPVHAVWVAGDPTGPLSGSGKTVVYFSGNLSDIYDGVHMAMNLRALGVDVLTVEYRGYGITLKDFSITEASVYEDGRIAYNYLRDTRGVRPENIVMMGYSLGSAVVVDVVSQSSAAAVILISPMYNSDAVATSISGGYYIDSGWFIDADFDNASKIKRINCPLVIFHGRKDTFFPYRQSVALFQLANEPKYYYLNETASHPDMLGYWSWYGDLIRSFLERSFKK